MGRLKSFNFVTLNGYFKGSGGNISWHIHDAEGDDYATEMLLSGDTLLFGRVTYELMAGYWPSDEAKKSAPFVAEGMNKAHKIVFSRTLEKADWNNTRVMNDDIAEKIKKMKQQPGKNMTILGSGSIVTMFADLGLIDQYQIMVDPVVMDDGTPLFKGIKNKLNLKLTFSRTFKSGSVLLYYEPIKN